MIFNFEPTGVGSTPFKDEKTACRIICENFSEIPFWPQLPKIAFLENMYVQFSEKIPGIVIDEKEKACYIDSSRVSSEIEEVYGKYIEQDLEYFAISQSYAKGFYEFLEILKTPPKSIKFVKGQITGPVSYALFLTSDRKKAVIYDKDLFEVLTKVLVMKVKWQIKKLKKLFPNVIIFIDEPYLVSIGSSFVNINKTSAFEKLDEVISAIKSAGALAAIHCCGNTDWSGLLKRDIDILSFDAYNFTKEFLLYPEDISAFLKRGAAIAWGIIPSNDDISKEGVDSLSGKLTSIVKSLKDKGIAKENISSIITPSCGLGTLSDATAKKIIDVTKAVSDKVKRR